MLSMLYEVVLSALVQIEQLRSRLKLMLPFAFGWSAIVIVIVCEVKTRDNHHSEECDQAFIQNLFNYISNIASI